MPRPIKSQKRISEYKDKTIEVRRVTRVVAGGKRFSFRATVVVGNLRGKVGVGVAKGLDVAQAVQKARRKAEKNTVLIPIVDGRTIPYDVTGKYGASRVLVKPARKGNGLIAGGSCRIVLDLVGIKDISAKILSHTTNKLTNAMAAIEALKQLREPVKHKTAPEISTEEIDNDQLG